MAQVRLEEVAVESRETYKGDKTGMPIVGLEHLIPGEVTLANWDSDTENTFTKRFRKGDMLFGRRRAYLKKAAQAPVDGICSSDITVIRAKAERLMPELLPFVIQNDNLFEFSVGRSAGSLSPRVKWDNLKNYTFELPSMEEQRKLAKVLWAINDTLQAYQNLLAETDALVQAQFIEMFGDFKNNANVVKLEAAFFIRDDLRKPINDAVRFKMHTGDLYPYYGANGQVDSINEYLMDCEAICLAEDCGSYGAGEPTSYIVSGKCWVNNHAHVLIPKACCDIEFANVYFRLLDMTGYVTGTTRLKLTQAKMKTIPMILPPINQQKQFAVFVQQCEQAKRTLQNAITSLQATKRSLLENALGTGRKE